MLWDIPEERRLEITQKILSNPVDVFRTDDQLFLKALNTLKWYELIHLIDKQNLVILLTDSTIQKLFPVQRRTYYTNARRLLSKYSVADEGFARILITEGDCLLKLDFVNDIPFRSGIPVVTPLFIRTDNLKNILSNKVTALGRYSPKDVVDIVYISVILRYKWENIMADASEKDLWVNPVNVAEVLEAFPVGKPQEIAWINEAPSDEWFNSKIDQIIPDILFGSENSLYTKC